MRDRVIRCLSAVVVASLLTGAAGTARAADCTGLVASFNQAIEGGQETQAQTLLDKIATDADCGRFQVPSQRRLAAFRLLAAQTMMARGRPHTEYGRLLTDAERAEVLWQAAATLGDVYFGERRFADSAMAFDRAIEIVKNETLTPNAPSKFEIESLFERAAQSRILAANGSGAGEGVFVKTARDQRDGHLGGLYAPSLRGITLRIVPVPITFDYAKTNFTSVGEQAARELVTAIKEQGVSKITLIGHTDVRGSAETNMKLSEERALAVAGFLRRNGIEASIDTVGKGATEPMKLTDSAGLSQEDIYSLNRRVEWRRSE
jgi:outer membrane protein OmpA-like peptidoglycan-associated protein